MLSRDFGVSWRKALVSLPRLVPEFVLRFTSPEGPHPIIFDLPSRGSHLIPVYVFVPPHRDPHHHRLVSEGAHLGEALHPKPHPGDDPDVKLPVLIDFHGGGFVLGSCQEQTPFCAQMCRELNCVVVSVDYRLGPSSQYPAANYDAEDVVWAVTDPSKQAYRALRAGIHDHLAEHDRKDIVLDEDRVAFSGFSSGANLALNLVLGVKDDPTVHADWPSPVSDKTQNDIPVLLFYPSLDCRLLPHERPRPRPEGVDADAATAEAPKGFVERWRIEAELMPTYLPVDQRAHPRASPGLADLASPTAGLSESAPEETWGLHPRAKMLLVLPEFDSLHEQSMAWIDKVRDQGRGADLTVEQIKGVPHGWTQFPDAWLHDEAKKLKYETFHKARDFVQGCWGSPSQP